MNQRSKILIAICFTLVAGCDKDPAPRSVMELADDPILLEAALVRCAQNRGETRYEFECVNAREAVKMVEAQKEAERRAERESQSQRKREALRRTQQAAAEARRRAIEDERLRKEAEYEAQFGELPGADDTGNQAEGLPAATAPKAVGGQQADTEVDSVPAPGADAPPAEDASDSVEQGADDLGAIRDELKRRNQNDD